MVEAVRTTEKALGRVSYEVTAKEKASRAFRRSLFVVQEVKAGDMFTEMNVRSIRPGYGLPPKYLSEVLGQRAACDILRGTPLAWQHVAR
jgi:sialic acid synthase SpsE